MNLYYTGEDNGNPMISFPYTQTAIDGTISSFDDTVHHIIKKILIDVLQTTKLVETVTLDFIVKNKRE